MVIMILLFLFGSILLALSFLGCFIPVLPGPFLAFMALLVLGFVNQFTMPSIFVLCVMGVLAFAITLVDYFIPVMSAKKFGVSKFGSRGALIGTFLGLLAFPPFGAIIGALLGAMTGQFIKERNMKTAFYAGWSVFIGISISTGVKVAYSVGAAYFFITFAWETISG